MVNWGQYKYNDELLVTIVDDEVSYNLKVKIVEFEYNLHRQPFLADLKVLESTETIAYPIDSVLRLPMETSDYINFLLFAPCDKAPNRELKGEIIFELIEPIQKSAYLC